MTEELAAVAEDWQLRLGDPYPPGAAGYVVRSELADGTPAVLDALLLERRESGTPLSQAVDDPLAVLIDPLPRLWSDTAVWPQRGEVIEWLR